MYMYIHTLSKYVEMNKLMQKVVIIFCLEKQDNYEHFTPPNKMFHDGSYIPTYIAAVLPSSSK